MCVFTTGCTGGPQLVMARFDFCLYNQAKSHAFWEENKTKLYVECISVRRAEEGGLSLRHSRLLRELGEGTGF